jgi:hypothetical protein
MSCLLSVYVSERERCEVGKGKSEAAKEGLQETHAQRQNTKRREEQPHHLRN